MRPKHPRTPHPNNAPRRFRFAFRRGAVPFLPETPIAQAPHARALPVLLLVSRADPASVTIRDALLDMEAWKEVGAHRGLPVRALDDRFLMVEDDRLHLDCDHLDRHLREQGWAFDAVLVASKHRAESGKPALTVHPIGNLGDSADFGGLPRRVVPSAPVLMGRVLRRLAAEAVGIRHEVTFEATHHGPYLDTPTAFVEIGTDEASWRDADLGRRVARALLAADRATAADDAPVLVGLGGSHYAPRMTDLARRGRANFGHVVPGYALERGVAPRVLLECIERTPGCRGYYLDPRLVEKRPDDALQVFAGLELGWWTEDDLGRA